MFLTRAFVVVAAAVALSAPATAHSIPEQLEFITQYQTVPFDFIGSSDPNLGEPTLRETLEDGWNGYEDEVELQFDDGAEISQIGFFFESTDPDYNVGPGGGANGGDPYVILKVVLFETAEEEVFPIASMNAGVKQNVILQPQNRQLLPVADELVEGDGVATLSLGAAENIPGCCALFLELDEPSTLLVTVSGITDTSPPHRNHNCGLVGLELLLVPLLAFARRRR